MTIFANLGLGMVGFLIGNLLFSAVAHWGAAIYEAAKDQSKGGRAARIAAATLLNSGPWLVVVVAFVAYFVHDKPWVLPIIIGVVLAIAVFTGLTLYFWRKQNQRGSGNAA